MQEISKLILSLSLSGGVVILGLFFLSRLLGYRVSRRWQYQIWLIAVLRLLLPFSAELNLVGTVFANVEQAVHQEEIRGLQEDSSMAETDSPADGLLFSDDEAEGSLYHTAGEGGQRDRLPEVFPAEGPGFVKYLTETFALIWLSVALLLLAQRIMAYRNFVRTLQTGCIPADVELLERFGRIAEERKIKGTIELCIHPLAASPMLVGLFRPKIILPTAELSEQDFYYTILHELIHYRRMDLLYKWLVQFTVCLHWFNPLVWLMGREVNRTCELACDEAVLRELDSDKRRAYGDTLLRAAALNRHGFTSLGTLTMHESKKLLKRRLQSIIEYQKKPGWIKAASLALAVMIAVGALTLGVYAGSTLAGKGKDFLLLGTYAKPSITSGGTDFLLSDGTPVIERDQVFYILCDGVTEVEVSGGSTVGGIMISVVHKDAYVSIMLSEDIEELKAEAEEICEAMLKRGSITEKDAGYLIEVAEELQNRDDPEELPSYEEYYYIQSMYYRDGYLFAVGYDLTEEQVQNHPGTEITLQDGEELHISFADTDKKWIEHTEFLQVLNELFSEFRQKTDQRVSRIQRPMVSRVEYIGTDIESLVASYYKEDDLGRFSAVFPELPPDRQKDYLEQAFQVEETSYFAIILNTLRDKEELDEAMVNDYMQRAYDLDKISCFAVCSDYLSEDAIQSWKERLPAQGKDYPYTSIIQGLTEEDLWEDY